MNTYDVVISGCPASILANSWHFRSHRFDLIDTTTNIVDFTWKKKRFSWILRRLWSILYHRENVRWFWHICLHLVQRNVSNASRSNRLWHRNQADCCDIHNSPDRIHSNSRKVVVLRVELKAREEAFSFSSWSTRSSLLFPTKIDKRSNRQIVELPMMINELYKLKVKKETKKEKKKWERYNNQVKQRYNRRWTPCLSLVVTIDESKTKRNRRKE